MKKHFFITLILVAMISMSGMAQSIYDFKVQDIDGKEFNMADLKGKKVLIVNTASKCGFTPQYEDLEKLYNTYKDQGFVIIAFPANNFLSQEPGTDSEIKSFCQKNYGVSFPIMSKISVKGKDMHPIYQWLTEKEKNGVMDSEVKWNFQKYAIDEDGNLVKVFYSRTKPFDDEIVNWIKG